MLERLKKVEDRLLKEAEEAWVEALKDSPNFVDVQMSPPSLTRKYAAVQILVTTRETDRLGNISMDDIIELRRRCPFKFLGYPVEMMEARGCPMEISRLQTAYDRMPREDSQFVPAKFVEVLRAMGGGY